MIGTKVYCPRTVVIRVRSEVRGEVLLFGADYLYRTLIHVLTEFREPFEFVFSDFSILPRLTSLPEQFGSDGS